MVKQWIELLGNNLSQSCTVFYNDFVLENSTISRARPQKSVGSCLDSQGQCSYVNTSAEIGPCIAFSYSENQEIKDIELTDDRKFKRLGSTALEPQGKRNASQL